ncbi:MAG: alpha-galactosidase [Oscillospiraceae bacterium]|nr:alpha-galactosidase [Oscillospiraceae bacterium]
MRKLPPMMGWSTWNQFHQNISEDLIMDVARSMKASGLLAAGYRYLNLDDCWQASQRDTNGQLAFDIGRFPSREGLVDKLNAMGFNVGLYSSCGAFTCEDMPGSYGHEALDARTFAHWGVEYLKYDYCHVVDLPTDPHFEQQNFADTTPPILYIGLTPFDGSAAELRIDAADAELTAPAVLQNGVITGLECPRAAARFTVNVPKAGEYQVAVGYEKRRDPHRKFVLLAANGEATQVWFPPTSGWFSPARVTANITLQQGENTLLLTNPIRGQRDDTILRYTKMGQALNQAAKPERPICFSICEHGRTQPWLWAGEFGGSWRVCGDISASWEAVLRNYEAAADLWWHQQPGAYNDLDMLEVGIGDFSHDENLSHFALWCMMSAPLVLGLDARNILPEVVQLVTNPALIALNQDALLLQASRFTPQPGLDLLLKPLADGSCALCLFNKSDEEIAGIAPDLDTYLAQDERLPFRMGDNLLARDILIPASEWAPLNRDALAASLRPRSVALWACKQA